LQKLEDVPEDLRLAAARLTTRVTPTHELPHAEDPLEDAQAIVQALMKEVGLLKIGQHYSLPSARE